MNGPIVVDGATGYVGSHLVANLAESGFSVRCLVHKGAREKDIQFLKSLNAEVYIADLENDSQVLNEAFAGAETAVHLIGSIAPPKGQTMQNLHVNQTKQLVDLCRKNKIKKVVMVTALGSSSAASSNYHSTKWQAEEILRSSGLNHVIMRPSLIFGRQVGNRDSKLVARLIQAIESKPVVPLINGGVNLIQPIFIGDLIDALTVVIERDDLVNQTFELGGANVISMKQFVDMLMDTLAVKKPVVSLPTPVAAVLAACMEATTQVPLISRDQVRIAKNNNVCATNDLSVKLGIEPRHIKLGLNTYKEKLSLVEEKTS
ncbi:MAG: NAD(P)H-binding protein [Candidatus Obscuribacterales bacterium]|nr:NAD(P)H-binding protein [Candidatus Obscuribacterales bacterium]